MGLKTIAITIKSTASQFICSSGLFTRWFRTYNARFRYTQLEKAFGSFYADYLKLKTKSLWGYIWGVVFTNKFGLYKFIPYKNDTSENNGRSLGRFIDLVGLPLSLHFIITGTSRMVSLSNF